MIATMLSHQERHNDLQPSKSRAKTDPSVATSARSLSNQERHNDLQPGKSRMASTTSTRFRLSREEIQEELDRFGKLQPTDEWSHRRTYKYYGYCMIFDGAPCLKLGITRRLFADRVYEYVNRDHPDQIYSPGSFRLLFILTFDSERTMKDAERLVHGVVREYPLRLGQHPNIEQYQLLAGWEKVAPVINSFPFARVRSVDPSCTDLVHQVVRLHTCLASVTLFMMISWSRVNDEKKEGVESATEPVPVHNPSVAVENPSITVKEVDTDEVSDHGSDTSGGCGLLLEEKDAARRSRTSEEPETDTPPVCRSMVVWKPSPVGELETALERLNAARERELQLIQGIGPVLSRRIVEHQPFTHLGQVRGINRIGPVLTERILNHFLRSGVRVLARRG